MFVNGMRQHYNTVFDATKGTVAQKTEAATRAVVREYKLGHYAGKGAKLERVR